MARTITRPQGIALRNAEELPEELLRPTDALRGHLVISARPNTLATLVRLGLAEGVEGQYVLTRAGYTVRAITDLPEYLPRLDTVASIVAAAAEEADMAAEETTRPSDGTYYPSEAGARGWRDAVPLWFNGHRVSAIVENDGQDLYVFLGTETIYDGDMPSGVTGDGDVNTWVRQYATGYVWAAEYRTLWSYRDWAGRVWGPYADAEFRHTDSSAERYCRGIVDANGTGEVIRTDRRPEHFDTVGRNWTDTRTVVHVAGAPAAEDTAPAEEAQEAAQEAAPALSGLPLPVVTVAEVLELLEPVPFVDEPYRHYLTHRRVTVPVTPRTPLGIGVEKEEHATLADALEAAKEEAARTGGQASVFCDAVTIGRTDIARVSPAGEVTYVNDYANPDRRHLTDQH